MRKSCTSGLNTVAVLGNHDHWNNGAEIRAALTAANVTLLANEAVRRGVIAIGGLDDDVTHRADLPLTAGRMAALGGVPVLLSHSPDPFASMPAAIGLMLAGHTHCGQISLPGSGPIMTASRYGRRYACGVIRERRQTLVVSAGLGTSMLPMRLGTRPDFWSIDIGGVYEPAKSSAER